MQNITCYFSDDVSTLNITNGVHKGEYKAVADTSCSACSFYGNELQRCQIGGSPIARCTANYRPTGNSIIWEKQKVTPRPHAELIKRWADDASLKVFCWDDNNDWDEITRPTWIPSFRYVVAKEKPTEIPIDTYKFNIAGKEYTLELLATLSPLEVEERFRDFVYNIAGVTCTRV